MKNLFFLLFTTSLLIVSCGTSEETLQLEIDSASEALFSEGAARFDEEKAAKLSAAYESYIGAFPKSDSTPVYLFKQAELLRSMRDFTGAIGVWEKINNDYPTYEKTPQSFFLIGFTYENNLKDLKKAKKYYEDFLVKFPKHEFVKDAQFSLKNLGRPVEDILKEFQEKRAAQEAAKAEAAQ
ncbi:tetratricopeptide repeat protein [Chitinophagales bacterium]|nr:tetratricopeptide repeat protein [Chitinophagales bacterium]